MSFVKHLSEMLSFPLFVCLKIYVLCFRKQVKKKVVLKKHGDPTTITYNDCPVCLIQNLEVEKPWDKVNNPDQVKETLVFVCNELGVSTQQVRRDPDNTLKKNDPFFFGKTQTHHYDNPKSFEYDPIMFKHLKHLGFCPMHRRIRTVENVCHMAEVKFAKTHYLDLYYANPTKANPNPIKSTVKIAHEHFKAEFLRLLNLKYFVPDPQNGGNSNTGPSISRLLSNISISASILEISPVTLRLVGKCCHMINRTKFVKPHVYDKFARAAFFNLMCDLGNFSNMSSTTHGLFCHGSLYIKSAQTEYGLTLGDLSENSIEMGNKVNLKLRKMFSRKSSIKAETKDIMNRKLLISCPYVIIEGKLDQVIRRGNIRGRRRVKQKENSFLFPPSSFTLYCPRTPGGELAARWREVEASTWPRPRLDASTSTRFYRYTVVER